MAITHLEQIVSTAAQQAPKRIAVAAANDPHTIEAVAEAWRRGLIKPLLFGKADDIKKLCTQFGIDADSYTIEDANTPAEAAAMAVAAVSEGRADILMKGLVSSDQYLRAILNKNAALVAPKGILTHISVVELPGYPRLLTFSDVAVIPAPDFKTKTLQIKYLAQTANTLGIEKPKIACLAPSEQVLPSVVSSTEAALLAKMGDRGQLGKVIVDGPLSIDIALYPEVVKEKKLVGSPVAGEADCLLFPNIESGNVFFKACTHMAGASIAAMVVGAKVPCVLTSRGDTPLTKLYSIALACLSAK